MLFELIQNWRNYKKYKDSLVLDKYILQTSTKQELMSHNIQIKNFIMTKRMDNDGFLDFFLSFRPSYFDKFRAKKNILLEQFHELFGDFLVENDYYSIKRSYDLIINDFKEDIYIKEVIRDLIILEFQNKQILVFFGDFQQLDHREIGDYVLKEHPKFTVFKLQILQTYSLEELQTYFKLTFRQTNTLRVLDKIIKLFARQQQIKRIGSEDEKFTSLFSKNNVEALRQYEFDKYLYFNEDYKIPHDKLLNVASVGTTGSGKTFTLNLLLLQILFGGDFRRIIYFDTQNSFNETVMDSVNPIYLNKAKYLQDNYFKIDEKNFYLSELDFVMSVNFLLETKGYGSGEAKAGVVRVEYDDYENFREAVSEILQVEKKKLSVFKDLNKLEDLEAIDRFMKKVIVKPTGSIFDDLETREQFFAIFSFQDTFFYEVACYLYLQKFKDILYDRNAKKTYFVADETQKYLGSAFLKKVLLDLVKEKRQFGFRFYYTGLTYQDISSFVRFTQHIIFNSFNDAYMLNTLRSMSSTPIDSLKTPIEKIINDTTANKIKKTDLNLNLTTPNKSARKLLEDAELDMTSDEKEMAEDRIKKQEQQELKSKQERVVDLVDDELVDEVKEDDWIEE